MKASWNWLTDYVAVKAPVAEVAERLTMAGLIVEDIEQTAEDIVLEVEITSNRPDWLSHMGIARELAGLYGLSARMPEAELPEGSGDVSEGAALEVEDSGLCPLYTARVIRGVKVGPSPKWLRDRLEALGLRPVNNVVDATNYVMYECGQPLHAFDLDRIGGRKVIVRPGRAGEEIVLIDGSRHTLTKSDLVIADAQKPIALAGIMGGAHSEIAQDTANVFLESARFDPYSIRITAKRLGLSSDASYRFERGVDVATVDWASRRCASMIMELAGGTLEAGVLTEGAQAQPERTIMLRSARVEQLLGLSIPIDRQRAILSSLGFVLRGGSPDTTVLEVPSFRADVKEEADLIEEVARIYGFDRIPVRSAITIAAGRRTRREAVTQAAERVLTAAGYYGSVSFSLVSGDLGRAISPWSQRPPVFIENRAGQENAFMRLSLLASLLAVRKTNEDRKVERPDVYEVAHVYLPSDDVLPEQPLMAAAVTGDDFAALKGVVENLLEEIGGEGAAFVPASYPFLEEGQAADILLDGRRAGCIGRLAERLVRQVDLRASVCVAEVNLSILEALPEKVRTFTPLQRYPGIDRDIAIIVAEEVSWAQVVEAAASSGAGHIESVYFVSIYRGKPIAEAHKSLALRVVFRSPERTLTSEEADVEQARILAALEERLGARLR